MKRDRDIVLAAVKEDGYALKYADDTMKRDPDIVLAAVKRNGHSLRYADDALKRDPNIVLAAVKADGHALKYAGDAMKRDPDFVLAAVNADGYALKYADDALKRDPDIVLAAVKANGWALDFADDSMKRDRDIVLAAAKSEGFVLKFADDSMNRDPDIVLAAVKRSRYQLKDADDSMKRDPDIVLAAVRANGGALEYADDSMKRDPNIVLAAVKANGHALKYAGDAMKRDPDIVLAAVKTSGHSLEYADDALKSDPDIVLAATYSPVVHMLNAQFILGPLVITLLNLYWGLQMTECGTGAPLASYILMGVFVGLLFFIDLISIFYRDVANCVTHGLNHDFLKVLQALHASVAGKAEALDWMSDGLLPGQIRGCERSDERFLQQYHEAWRGWGPVEKVSLSDISLYTLCVIFIIQQGYFLWEGVQWYTKGTTPWAFYAHAGLPLSYSRPKEHSQAAFFGAVTRGLVEAIPSLFIITAYQALSWDISTTWAKIQNVIAMLLSFLSCLKQANVCFMLGAPALSRCKTNFLRLRDYCNCKGKHAAQPSEEQVEMLEQHKPEEANPVAQEEAAWLETLKAEKLKDKDVNPIWRQYASLVVGILILLGTFIAFAKFLGIFTFKFKSEATFGCKSHFFNVVGWKCTEVAKAV